MVVDKKTKYGGIEVKFAPAICVFVVCFLLHFLLITQHVGYDESTFLSEGWMLSQKGYLLYSHNSNKMPLAYLMPQFLALFFSGVKLLLYSRLVACLLYSLLAFLLCLIVSKWFNGVSGFFAGLVFTLFSASGFTIGYTYVTYVMFAQLALFYMLCEKRFFWAGMCFALGLWRIQSMLFVLPLVLYRLLWSDRKIKDSSLFVLGFMLYSIPGVLWSLQYVDFSGMWFNLVEYNFLPVYFPFNNVVAKIWFLSLTFESLMPVFLVGLCSLGFILIDNGIDGWIRRGLVFWVLCLFLMVFMLPHVWEQYIMYFYIPLAILIGWFVSTLKGDNAHVLLLGIMIYFLLYGFIAGLGDSMKSKGLFMDVSNAFELQGCKNLYIIGNEDAYAVSGVALPQSEIDGRSKLFPDSWAVFTRYKEVLLDYGELNTMFNKTYCVAILPVASEDMSIVENPNLLSLLERNGFIYHYNMSWGGYLWKR